MIAVTLFCGAVILVAALIISVLLSLEILIEGERETWFGKFAHWLRTRDQMGRVIFLITVCGLAIVLFLYWYSYPPGGFKDFLQGITAEIAGGLIDLAVVGVVIGIYETRKRLSDEARAKKETEEKEKLKEIKELRSQIKMYIPLKNNQAKVEIMEAIKRLNELEVYDINLTRADLTVIDASKNDNNIRKLVLRGARFTETRFDGLNLHESEFIDCVASGFSFSNAPEIRAARSMFMRKVKFDGSHLQSGNFSGAYLNGASFKDVIFSGKTDFGGAVLLAVSFDGAKGQNMNFDGCKVGADFREKVLSWNLDTSKFFKNHVLISKHEPVRWHPDGTVEDVREFWYIANMKRFKDIHELFMHTHAEKEYSLEKIDLEEE